MIAIAYSYLLNSLTVVSDAVIAKMMGISPIIARQLLRALQHSGLIELTGRRNLLYWAHNASPRNINTNELEFPPRRYLAS